jgi:hypothetical protein
VVCTQRLEQDSHLQHVPAVQSETTGRCARTLWMPLVKLCTTAERRAIEESPTGTTLACRPAHDAPVHIKGRTFVASQCVNHSHPSVWREC